MSFIPRILSDLSMQSICVKVTLGGLEHGLKPIAAACPSVHVIEEPTLFLDALWLPYRREHGPLEQAIQEAGPVKAVFGHADVVRVWSC